MKITLLGTGTSQGVPVIGCNCKVCQSVDPHDKRLRTSALIESNDTRLVIDTGPDFRQQMLKHHVADIDGILYTHEHRDHIAGLDDVRAFNFIQKKPVQIYAEERVQNALKTTFSYSFEEKKYPGVPQLKMHDIDGTFFRIKDIGIEPIRAYHYKLPVYGFRFGDFTYITDANYINEEDKLKMAGTKFLVINALRKRKHISHFNLQEVLEIAKELSPKRTYITHISHQMGLHKEIENELPHNVFLGYDGLEIDC